MTDKEEFERQMKAQLDAWSAEMAKFKAQADKASADMRLEYYRQIDKLQEQQAAVAKKLKEMQDASESAWGDIRAGAEKAWDDMLDAWKTAHDRFR